jgi:DNA primase
VSDTVEQIKNRLDIVQVISGFVKLQKAGANWKARCPLHNEKTPSFYVSPERQSWHCFGCNKGGDMFSFLQEKEGMDFPEALRVLASQAGVVVPERGAFRSSGDAGRRERLVQACELAAKFFSHQLTHGAGGAKALTYLRGRGLLDDTAKAWRLGWAPNDWQALAKFLQREGVADADGAAAGVVIARDGRVYDRFRSRIMFPISDGTGTVVGFTGRVFGLETTPEGEPLAKYINTPQTPLYDKSKALFGLHHARTAIRERDGALLVEGNMDALMAWQAGVTNTVATSGTALTDRHLAQLGRLSPNVTFCFDADAAGSAATRRSLGLALSQGLSVRIITLGDPELKDPADYVAKHGVKFAELASHAVPAMEFYWAAATAGYDPSSAPSKVRVLGALAPLIRRLATRTEQSHWTARLASLLRTDQSAVAADIAAAKDDLPSTDGEAEVVPPMIVSSAPLDPASLELLALAVRSPELAASAADAADGADERVVKLVQDPTHLQAPPDEALRRLVDLAHLYGARYYEDAPPEQLAAQLAAVVARLRERRLKSHRATLALQIREAEEARDEGRLRELIGEFESSGQELNRLQSNQTTS